MWWFLIFILIIIAAFVFPRFGKGLSAFIGIIIIIGTIWYLYEKNEDKKSKLRILPSEIRLSEMKLIPGYSRESYDLVGRIKNNSQKYTLNNIRLNIVMKDCIKKGNCEIVGEDDTSSYDDVPPGQIRELKTSVYFSNLPKEKGKYEWNYTIAEIKGN